MGLFEDCLLVSDIDGTLVSEGEIPERNLAAIAEFKRQGGRFTIATGRSVESTRRFYQKSGANCAAVTFNGALLYDFENDEIIWETGLPDSAKDLLPPLLSRFPGVGVEVHCGRRLYVVNRTPDIDHHLAYESIPAADISLNRLPEERWTKVLFASSDEKQMAALHVYTADLEISGAYFLKTAPVYYELTCGGANKGAGLIRLAEAVGVSRDRVFAIGDYFNDKEMIENAAVGAFVRGAPEVLRPSADYIACSCEEGAVADFIAYLTHRMSDAPLCI